MTLPEASSDDFELEQYRSYLLALARPHLALRVQARLDASDIVQDTLAEAHRQREQFLGDGRPQFIAWLRQLLAGKLVDALRRETRDKRDVRREASWEIDLESSAAGLANFALAELSTPSLQLQREEVACQVAAALDALPEAQRQALTLRYVQNMTVNDIAANMDKTPVAVAGLLKRGLASLRSQLGTPPAQD